MLVSTANHPLDINCTVMITAAAADIRREMLCAKDEKTSLRAFVLNFKLFRSVPLLKFFFFFFFFCKPVNVIVSFFDSHCFFLISSVKAVLRNCTILLGYFFYVSKESDVCMPEYYINITVLRGR